MWQFNFAYFVKLHFWTIISIYVLEICYFEFDKHLNILKEKKTGKQNHKCMFSWIVQNKLCIIFVSSEV